jgi:hypothetical protein
MTRSVSILRCSLAGILLASPILVAAADGVRSLGAWQQYALSGLKPDFDWADKSSVEAPSVLNTVRESQAVLMPRLVSLAFQDSNGFGVSFSRTRSGDTPLFENGAMSALSLGAPGQGLERTLIAPSLTRGVGDDAKLTAGVVIAYQQFASWGLGSTTLDTMTYAPGVPLGLIETSMGTGVRVEVEQALSDRLSFIAGYQSQVNMDPFQLYRGVYSEPGDFDIPAVARAGMSWSMGSGALGFDVSRVMYSDVSPFASQTLPSRFLSLLGDGIAPEFVWSDLTVYSVDWTWQASSNDAIQLRYSTQQQPEPTSALLRTALEDQFTDDNFAVALHHRVGPDSFLRFGMSYAPSQYFLGNASYANRDAGDSEQIEAEAVWTVRF